MGCLWMGFGACMMPTGWMRKVLPHGSGCWQQTLWTNNKGATPVKLGAVKAYAFKGKQVDKTKIAVNPDDIRELKNVEYEVLDTAGPENGTIPQQRLRIYGEEDRLKGYDNVLVILEYETQEIDYFADDERIKRADYVAINDGTRKDLYEQAKNIIKRIFE